ncbi:hypothetical protein [Thermotoga sp. KOL6]|uniref:hypothetical protein n=1 Tax=Thermotoga sp. KOL6 TaxID=126741 RepID=UPI000C769316|nr:hypothetical protein [Thermotoga sp. KOL6]PLV58658.1 hypothetical protein AS005_07160 [Thermotoga sp. KOL6]
MRKFLLISLFLLAILGLSQEWIERSFGPVVWRQPSDWQEAPPLGVNSSGSFKGNTANQTLTEGVGIFFIYDVDAEDSLISSLSQNATIVDQGETSWQDLTGRYYKLEGNNLVFTIKTFPIGMKDLVIWSFVVGNPSQEDVQTLEKILSSVSMNEGFHLSSWKSKDGTLDISQNRNYVTGTFKGKIMEGVIIENNIFGWWKQRDSSGKLGPAGFWDGALKGRFNDNKLYLSFTDEEDPFSATDGTSVAFEKISGELATFPLEEVSVTETIFCRSIYEDTPFATDETFNLFDKRVVMWSSTETFENAHVLKWEWYDPKSALRETVYYVVVPVTETRYDHYDSIWSWVSMNKMDDSDLGNWRVTVYVDGKKADEKFFTLSKEPVMKAVETDSFTVEVPSYTYYELSEGIHYFIFDISDLIFAEAHFEDTPLENAEVYHTPKYELNFVESSMPDPSTGQNFVYWVIQFPERDGQYLYMSFYAPEEDFKRLESVFRKVVNSVELK